MSYGNMFLATLLLVTAATAPAGAATILTAELTHDQEPITGPLLTGEGEPRPLSFGTGTFILDDAMTSLTLDVSIFNIDVTGSQTPDQNDNLTAAHIHAPAPPGETAPVVWGFFGAPDNDHNPNDLVVTPFTDRVGGRFTSKWDAAEGNNTTLTAQLSNLLSGLAYVNYHTVQFPAGEIRGQIRVPEPAIVGLIGLALLSIAGLRRRKA